MSVDVVLGLSLVVGSACEVDGEGHWAGSFGRHVGEGVKMRSSKFDRPAQTNQGCVERAAGANTRPLIAVVLAVCKWPNMGLSAA